VRRCHAAESARRSAGLLCFLPAQRPEQVAAPGILGGADLAAQRLHLRRGHRQVEPFGEHEVAVDLLLTDDLADRVAAA